MVWFSGGSCLDGFLDAAMKLDVSGRCFGRFRFVRCLSFVPPMSPSRFGLYYSRVMKYMRQRIPGWVAQIFCRGAMRNVTLFTRMCVALWLAGSSPAASASNHASVMMGAVGHNDKKIGTGGAYESISLDEQFRLLKESGLTAYRSGCNESTCPVLIDLAKSSAVVLLHGLAIWPDPTLDEEANYQRGYRAAYADAKRYKGKFLYYSPSNELDNWTGVLGDGGSRIQYNPFRYPKARGFIKGLIDGVHDGDPAAKVMIDDAGWCHYGFLNALWADGVRWDITAFHWYSDQGSIESAGCRGANVAAIHAAFGRPVWITEFNVRGGSNGGNEKKQVQWVAQFVSRVREIGPRYNIQAAFVYELLDEPSAAGDEGFYGIYHEDGKSKGDWRSIFAN